MGVDADQGWVKSRFIIASMMKGVDIGVYTAVKKALDYYAVKVSVYGGALEPGLKEGGVGISTLDYLETFLEIAISSSGLFAEL